MGMDAPILVGESGWSADSRWENKRILEKNIVSSVWSFLLGGGCSCGRGEKGFWEAKKERY